MVNAENLKIRAASKRGGVHKLIRSKAIAGCNVRPVTTMKIHHNSTNYLAP